MKIYPLLVAITVGVLITACANLPPQHTMAGAANAKAPPQKPQKIALLLPLTGNVAAQARSIENGFFAGYYRDNQMNGGVPQVMVMNTSSEDLNQVYEKAINKGADIIVGPLLKSDVQALEQRTLPIPVLALNSLGVNSKNPNNSLFQFSLSPQDEAQQVAAQARHAGLKQALVIVPNSDWGSGIAVAFAERWQQMGGRVADEMTVSPNQDLTTAVKNLLHAQVNKANNDRDRQAEGQNIKRRQDFDVVFMALPPSQARQLVPLLHYFGVTTTPIYATSLVYSGRPMVSADRDLDGVIFCDMPASLGASSDSEQSGGRLYSFGEDAYQLASQLNRLAAGSTLNGRTGQLYLTPNMQVRRHLMCAQFQNGVPNPVA